jgi:ABC-type transporter Mla subunit MlaD
MAVVWGEAEITVHADGSNLPNEVRAIASQAGGDGADAFNKTWLQRLKAGLSNSFAKIKGWFTGLWSRLFRKQGKNLGDGFTDGFKESMKTFKLEFDKVTTDIAKRTTDIDFSKWGDDLGNLRRVFPEITEGFRQMAIEGNKGLKVWEPMIDDIGELKQVFDDTGDSAKSTAGDFRILWRELESGSGSTDKAEKSSGRLRNSMRRLRSATGGFGDRLKSIAGGFGKFIGGMDGITSAAGRQGSAWKRLSANTRQWTLIIGAVIGAMGDLAVLGSAAGAGILVLVGALASAGTAAVFSFVAFSRFLGDLEKVPDAVKPARKAFDNFAKTFSKVMDAMTVEAFKDTEDAWNHFGDVVTALEPGFKAIGKVVNGLIKDLAKNLDTSRVEKLNKFLEIGAGVLDRLVRAVGRLADALLDAFTDPTFLRMQEGFLTWLDSLIDKFGEFVRGPGFDEWLGNAEKVFGALGPLLGTVGDLLNEMVNEETVKNLVDFIDNIDRFLQGGGKGILDFAQELDIFGIVAEALAEFGDALEPLAGPMADFASALNDVFKAGIEALAPIIEDVAEALAPLVQNVADFMAENPKLFADALLAIAAGFIAIKAVGIAANITKALAGFVGVAGKKNTGKLVKFGVAIGGIALALQGLAEQNKAGGGLEGGGGGVLETIAGGALVGSAFGPIGAAIGALGGAIASMIQDMFLSPDIEGAWKTGWDQLFDMSDTSGAGIGQVKQFFIDFDANVLTPFWTVTIPGFFASVGEKFALGWEQIAGAVQIGWATVAGPFETGWLQIVTFFTVQVPAFFAGLIASFALGWEQISTGVATAWATIKGKFELGWQQIVNFFTVQVPAFFGGLVGRFQLGFEQIASGAATGWAKIKAKFDEGWNQIVTFFTVTIPGFFNSIGPTIQGAIAGLATWFARGFESIMATIRRKIEEVRAAIANIPVIGGLVGGGGGRSGSGGSFASGGIVSGPRRVLVGEAGPEAIVPLRRSLSQVDESVRFLSAIVQGKTGFASGGTIGGGKTLNIQPGAIVIQGDRDPNRTAVGVVNRIAERIAG